MLVPGTAAAVTALVSHKRSYRPHRTATSRPCGRRSGPRRTGRSACHPLCVQHSRSPPGIGRACCRTLHSASSLDPVAPGDPPAMSDHPDDRIDVRRRNAPYSQGRASAAGEPGICTSAAAGRHDDIPHRFRQGQTVLTSCQRSGNSVSLVLVRARGHAIQAQGCQSLPSPGRACPGASLAMPASP